MELVTTNTILDWLQKSVQEKQVIDPGTWVTAAQKLNILISDEHDILYDLQQKVAQQKVNYMESGDTVAAAKTKVEATDDYKLMLKQKAKIGMIEEAIRIAKIQSRIKDNEFKGY